MSNLETAINNIGAATESMNDLTDAVNVKKSTLDSSVSDAETARDQAASSAELAQANANDAKVYASEGDLPAVTTADNGTWARVLVNSGVQAWLVVAGVWALQAWLEGPRFDTVTDFFASTDTFTAGTYVRTDADGFAYKAVASGGHVTNAGGVEFEVLPDEAGAYHLRQFGAVGDYDAATEPAGKLAVNATDNFPALNAVRQVIEANKGGKLIVSGDGVNEDFWFSNTIRFQVSNFELNIPPQTTFRATVPTSFGTTVYVGEVGKSNIRVTGGGTVRNYLPDVPSLPLWAADTAYSTGDYVRTSTGHAYYCQTPGTSTTGNEPTAIAGSSYDGDIRWRDALNENGISVHGDDTYVIGMQVPEASNKGITNQFPPWRNCWFIGNVVGKTFHDGIEMKGNQGAAGQELLFAENGWMIDNLVKDAGRNGFHMEQPSFGTNKNRHMTMRGNICERNGYYHKSGAGTAFRINRCVAPVFEGNKALDSNGNAIQFRLCDDITGDIYVEDFGIFGVHMQENNGFNFSSVVIKGGSGGYEAFRENAEAGSGYIGLLSVTGGAYTYPYRTLARAGKVVVANFDVVPGSSGTIYGQMPTIPVGSISDSNTSNYTLTQDSQTVGATSRVDIINTTSPVQVISGSVTGNSACRVEIIVDGGPILTLEGNNGADSAGGLSRTFALPPIYAAESLVLRVNNNSGSTGVIGWSVLSR